MDLFRLIDATPNLDWLLLTKRPENISRMWCSHVNTDGKPPSQLHRENVWLGTSIENGEQMHRWTELAKCRDLAPVLWISAEPLLGPLDMGQPDPEEDRPDWIVFGGESDQGQPARRCDVQWIRRGVADCRRLGIVPFVKQIGSFVVDRNDAGFEADGWTIAEGPESGQPVEKQAWPTPVDVEHDINGFREEYQGAPCRVRLNDKAGATPSEWPLDLQVREFPETHHAS
jgi:protein gp37